MGMHIVRNRSLKRRPSPLSKLVPALGSAPLCFEPADSMADSARLIQLPTQLLTV